MNTSDRREFKRVLTRLGAVFGKAIDEDLLEAYFTALSPLSLEVVRRACDTATAEHRGFFPQPAELRDYAQASAPADRPRYREIDGERVYECLRCLDRGVEIVDRLRPEGSKICTSAIPCLCPKGIAVERAWQKPNNHGQSTADAAKINSRKIRDLEREGSAA